MDSFALPAEHELRVALAPMCARSGFSEQPLTSIRRAENIYASTYASEIVTCRFADGCEKRLLLKYMAALDESHRDHGIRGGVAYEARVYSEFLGGIVRPEFVGLHTASDGAVWLVLEFMKGARRLQHSEDETAHVQTAAWLGRFHATLERRIATGHSSRIRVYDAGFYEGWPRRTSEFARDWHACAPWLARLCANCDAVIAALLSAPTTLVHGEFYPHNILFDRGKIFPVDWESAALGAGEIDLAALTEDWLEDAEMECQRAYQSARWPEGAPAHFAECLTAARIYMQLRWMGEHPGWTEDETEAKWRLAELKRWAERFGLEL
jgi:thiamine kinase-like enzyme